MGNSGVDAKLKLEIQVLIDSNPVLVISKTYCPYCTTAKGILNGLDALPSDKLKIVELDTLSNGGAMQNAAQSISSQRTVPQIWIGQKFIGGCSDLQQISADELVAMVEKALE